jgi:tetratricopeptide (TPR) repeat protein
VEFAPMAESGMLLNPEEVEFLLDSGATAKTGDCDIAQEVTMRGDLDQISLADIFQTLAMAKMEGLLRIRNPLEQRMLHFHDGFVRILVPNRVVVRRLGQRLVHAGLLQPDALRLALLEQRRCELPIGQILVHQGHVTQDQVEQVVTQQVTEELFGLFTWRHGTFEFFKGSISDPTLQERFDKCVEYEVNSLLLEVARRTDEWEVIAEALVSLDEIPGRNPDAPQSTAGLSEQHQILLEAVDGRLSYRELAEQSMMPLFDTARAARDLVHQGLIRNQPDPSMIEAARHHIELGNQKRALMVVQALRDRNREHEPAVLMAMAEVLRQCGESRSASAMLLQVARASSDPAEALELARQARTASDRDPEVLSFLRECMLRAGTATPQELEATTLALLDELIDRSDSEGALQILEECEQADQAGPQMLARKARIQQRHKDIPGAVATLMRIAELYSAVGNRSRMVEAYELILKLDRSRRDIAKLLKKMRSTRAARIARAAVLLAIVLMVAGGSTVMMQRQQREQQMLEGSTRIAQLLRANDRIGARQALQALREAVGDRPELEDLQRQLQFADASEVNARRRSERRAAMERMAEAAELLTAGALRDSLVIYSELAQSPQLQTEVREVVETRLEAARAELETLAKILAVDLPLPPTPVPDRRLLHDGLQLLRTRFQPQKLRLASAMLELNTNNSAPALVSAEQADRLVKTAAQAQPLLQRAQERIRQYEEALARVDADRRLEPLFRAALEHERQYDFRAALEAYRRLKREHGDGPMTTHFRDLIERYAGIMRATSPRPRASTEPSGCRIPTSRSNASRACRCASRPDLRARPLPGTTPTSGARRCCCRSCPVCPEQSMSDWTASGPSRPRSEATGSESSTWCWRGCRFGRSSWRESWSSPAPSTAAACTPSTGRATSPRST